MSIIIIIIIWWRNEYDNLNVRDLTANYKKKIIPVHTEFK